MGTVGSGGALSAPQCKVLLLGGRQTNLSLVHISFISTKACQGTSHKTHGLTSSEDGPIRFYNLAAKVGQGVQI